MSTRIEVTTETAPVVFPPGFLWGAATAAYQIEGAVDADGRQPSIWDTFSAQPGAVDNGDTGVVAADHYRRMLADVGLMAELGLPAYRFSVAWPRVLRADGTVNSAGLGFYDRLVDELSARGIEPWLTLYHWDLPQTLQDLGGWAVRETAHRLVEFAEVVYGKLGDRVGSWTTMNEPWCAAFLGYASGQHAPGLRDPESAVAAAHHLLLAHGLTATRLRELAPDSQIGIVLNLSRFLPRDADRPDDQEAVRRLDGQLNRLFLDPLYLGRYPADVVEDLARFGFAEHIRDGDLELIATPLDMVGVNYYNDAVVAGPGPRPISGPSPYVGAEQVTFVRRDDVPRTAMDWEVHADGLRSVLERVHCDYPGWSLYVTENGAAYRDVVAADGSVHDPERIGYLRDHLRACAEAVAAGVDLQGYFVWSLLDNFEWAYGYDKRFGIVHVDYRTQRRTPKSSARWYAEVIAANRV